ncbi:extracellular solute-binding protein [Paenibacillus thalictri]|uniref:Extracellular solute-binding protein n=1 Tax=Paenibacillus thalictri TaxID=2527873 RepID=A0A4Q9DUM9_9BACL|nr:extracellular solute-binding protein [Paenibacillus thalictri]TBL80707.1 extracellular solute-binding protein [Paenibacillus thalictri]
MKNKKSLISFMAAVLSCSVALSACGGGKTEGTGGVASGAASGSSSDKKVKITMFQAGSYSQTAPVPKAEDDPIRAMLEKSANIDLQMTVPQPGQENNTLNTLIASGDIPDMIFFKDKTTAVQYYDQGVLADLDDIVKKYNTFYGHFKPNAWDALKYKGKLIGTPGYELVQGINGWWIRNDWLKKLNLKVPTTTDELLEVMKAFTTKDPDGNGKDDTYGFVTGVLKDGSFVNQNAVLGIETVMWMFGVNPNTVDIKDNKLVIDNVDPRMKEAVTFLNKMVSEKVIDPDWVSISDSNAVAQKFYKGKVGVIIRDWRSLEPATTDKMKEVGGEVPDWIAIAPPKGPSGEQILGLENLQSNMWSISKKAAADPEKMKRIFDMLTYWYTDKDAYPYFSYGIKGINWDMKDGKLVRMVPSKEDNDKYLWTGHYKMPRKADDAVYYNFQNPRTEEFQKIYQKYVKSNTANGFVVPDTNDSLFKDREKYVNEMLLKFITGKESLANWDNYVKTLDSKFNQKGYVDNVTKQLKDQGILK